MPKTKIKRPVLSRTKIARRKKALRQLAKQLTLRAISALYGGDVSFQVIGRFIREKDYVPSAENKKVCVALDLYLDDNPYRILPRWYKRIPAALQFYEAKRAQIKGMQREAKEQRNKR